ncbi:MAG: succinate dehydrogenase/fumarate reductase iron-sulfur subunit [Oligoflexia bacterium]|nr:succinate dehydrogenase/fumarate reductase iron-sulfur subunit [Oligoflexia bacterium]
MTLFLKIWRQKCCSEKGKMCEYTVKGISPDISFLEMLDILNQDLIKRGEEPVVFDHDCREGICGACSLVINGIPHGPEVLTTTCQLHMRKFKDGDTIVIEPFRAKAFPVIRDLMVDRVALDEIITSGGYISANTGAAPEANSIPVRQENAELSMDAAACVGCGACVAACNNASAMLFVGAKVSHLGLLPQGEIEGRERVYNMVKKMDELGFGNCTNEAECEAVCPKGIKLSNIARLNRQFALSSFLKKDDGGLKQEWN